MIETENQHWVPKLLLRRFASNDGRLYFFDLESRTVGKRPPKKLASRENFNELLVSGEPQSFEQFFQKIETRAAPVIDQIIEFRALNHITPEARLKLSTFLAAQSFRSDAYREGLKLGRTQIGIGDAISLLAESIEPLACLINMRRWALMRAPKNSRFLLGDNPLVLQNTEQPGAGGALGLDLPGIEAFLPISPEFALYLPSRSVGDQIIAGYSNALCIVASALADQEPFSTLGTDEYELARRILGNSEGLYRALRFGEVLDADLQNVINLNSLQIRWASSKVFSNIRDFSFVEHVLEKTPEYAEIIPVNVIQNRHLTF